METKRKLYKLTKDAETKQEQMVYVAASTAVEALSKAPAPKFTTNEDGNLDQDWQNVKLISEECYV